MSLSRYLLLIALYGISPVTKADSGITLEALYQASQQHDARYQAAGHERTATLEEETIGRARLLPQVFLNSRYGQGGELGDKTLGIDQTGRISADSISLSVQQTLYDQSRWNLLEQSRTRGRIGEILFQQAEQALFGRVVDAYFDVARLENELKLNTQQMLAIEGLVQQTRRLLDAGEGTITDQEEAQARQDLVKAQGIELQSLYRAALHKLAARSTLPVSRILSMQERLPPNSLLDPVQNLEYWLDLARAKSPQLALQQASLDLAGADVELQRAGHLPTLSLTGQVTHTGKSDLDEFSQRQSSYYVGVMVDVPLYLGGGVSASVKRSQATLSATQANVEAEWQQLAETIESNYLAVITGYEKSRALQRAVYSGQRALLSVQKGYQAGTRSTVDILEAQQRVFTARRDLLASKLVMLQSYVNLHSKTGQMSAEVLQRIQAVF